MNSLGIGWSNSSKCPKCKTEMRNIRQLMMGPKWECEKCDKRYWGESEQMELNRLERTDVDASR